jgi:hypothetical protein
MQKEGNFLTDDAATEQSMLDIFIDLMVSNDVVGSICKQEVCRCTDYDIYQEIDKIKIGCKQCIYEFLQKKVAQGE